MTQLAAALENSGIVKLGLTVSTNDSPPVTPRNKTHEGIKIYSPTKGGPQPRLQVDDSKLERTDDDIHETTGKTNHLAGLCFGTAVFFMGLAFYDGYCFFGKRAVSLLLKGIFWALVASVIGTAGEILQKTTKVETLIVPSTIYHVPATLKEGQFPGMPNVGNTCFINAPTQAIMTDDLYPRVYKTICERAKARHISFKSFLELYPAQSGVLSSVTKIFSRKREVEPPLAVVNIRDVLVMLMMKRSSLNYDSTEFLRKYPNIHRLIGEFSTITKDADFPAVPDDNEVLRQEFALMKGDSDIVRFFDQERIKIGNEILGFDAFLNLIQAYEAAVEQKLPVVSFGRWFTAPIGNIRHLIRGAGGVSQEDVEEFLHCLSKYVLPDDYPEVFFPLAYERVWEECPEAEQDAEKLQELLTKHQNPRHANDLLTGIPDDKTILDKSSPVGVLQIKGLLREAVGGQTVLNETLEKRRVSSGPNDPNKETHFYLDSAGRVKNYYLVSEKIIAPKRMPDRIILELIRYNSVDSEQGRRSEKIECAVYMPPQINFYDQTYSLKSVVLHSGSLDNGHYKTIVNKDDTWWYSSDSVVDTAEDAHVQLGATEGCLYFYAKNAD
jgi:ubiquitin C-terminal hydrolase